MTYTAKEKKLIALAMNGTAHVGEPANAARQLFSSRSGNAGCAIPIWSTTPTGIVN